MVSVEISFVEPPISDDEDKLPDTPRTVRLPKVCMRCGQRATVFKAKTFAYYPGWGNTLIQALSPLVVVASSVAPNKTRWITLEVPLCDDHKNHLLWPLIVFSSLLALIAAGMNLMILVRFMGVNRPMASVLMLGLIFLFLAWYVMARTVLIFTVRARKITDRTITLTGVSRDFKVAYEEARSRIAPDLDRKARERWHEGRRDTRRDDERYSEDEPEPRRRSERFQEEED